MAGGLPGVPEEVVWHDLECGGYAADLALWRELAEQAGGPVLEVGAGTGRVALDLARHGHDVTALDSAPALLDALRERAAAEGLEVEAVRADARDFELRRRFALCVVPMQTVQILGGADGRQAFLRRAREHLQPGGLLAAALAAQLEAFDAGAADPPLPDVREHGGWVYSSQPVGVRVEREAMVIERVRETVAPDGALSRAHDHVSLDRLGADELAAEAGALGYERLPAREIAATAEHVASGVAVLRRR